MTTSERQCPYYIDNTCQVIYELSKGKNRHNPAPNICKSCLEQDSRVNLLTITLSGEDYDVSKLGNGFGSTLERIFGVIFQKYEGCNCSTHRDILDLWTPEYIKTNINKVVDWLAQEARKRKLPFSYRTTKLLLLSLLKLHR